MHDYDFFFDATAARLKLYRRLLAASCEPEEFQ